MGEKVLESLGPAMTDPISKGVKFRFMGYESRLPNFNHVPGEVPHIELKTLTDVPIAIVCTEKEACNMLAFNRRKNGLRCLLRQRPNVRELGKGSFPLLLGQRKTLQPNITRVVVSKLLIRKGVISIWAARFLISIPNFYKKIHNNFQAALHRPVFGKDLNGHRVGERNFDISASSQIIWCQSV